MKKQTTLKNRHTFYFKLESGQTLRARAKVKAAKKIVKVTLNETHARQSLASNGQGNSLHCAMAVCSKAHGEAFPHPFHFVDWLDSRAYFVTKVNSAGLPSECVVYTHHDSVAKLFDTRPGMKKLLKTLQERGDLTVTLYPPKVRAREPNRPRGNPTGERKRLIKGAVARGAVKRFIRASMGLSQTA